MKLNIMREIEVDLDAIPYLEWPDEAKMVARHLMSRPGFHERMQRQLFPKSFLISEVERRISGSDEKWRNFLREVT